MPYTTTPLDVRFWAKIDRSAGPDGCWPWTASLTGGGYGQIGIGNGRNAMSHRLSYELHAGSPIPRGLSVLHRCDNRPCCNPAHLFLGTQADNIADMDRKGRARRPTLRGERAGLAKLTDEQVMELRALYAAGTRQIDLAARFGVRQSTVSSIVRRATWSHI